MPRCWNPASRASASFITCTTTSTGGTPVEVIGGLEYNAGCWAARFVVQRLEAISGSSNTTFFFQLELNDFASVGSNPIQLLRRTIPGYGKVNEMPTTGSLLTSQ